MTGKGHIASAAVLLADMYLADFYITKFCEKETIAQAALLKLHNGFNVFTRFNVQGTDPLASPEGKFAALCIAFSFVFYALGSILPDIDTPTGMISSSLGFHLPVPHRGITHSVWFILPFIALGTLYYPFYYMALGMATHLLMDSFSSASICLFYPFGKYKVFNGVIMRPKKRKICYKTGQLSEKLLIASMYLVTFLVIRFS